MSKPGLERSPLIIPATDWSSLEQAVHSEADLIVVDLDDLVALEHKAEARRTAIRAFKEIDWKSRSKAIRINALNTRFAYQDLTEIVREVGNALELILIPKVDRIEDVRFIDTLLTQLEAEQHFLHQIQLELQIETALGLSNVTQIAGASLRITALDFGPGDYGASMNFPIQSDTEKITKDSAFTNVRLQFALHQIAVAARAAGLRVIDGPFGDINDQEGFIRSCRDAYALGCDGKWCLDATQVSIANEIFLPTIAQIQYAQEVLSIHAKATAAQQPIVFLRGKLIDMASLKSAQNTLTKARQAKLL